MYLDDFGCAICQSGMEETVEHLFLKCSFAFQCWHKLGPNCNLNIEPFQLLETFKTILQVPFFMEIIVLMCWSIWRSRNALVFEPEEQSVNIVLQSFSSHFSSVIIGGKSRHVQAMKAWLDSFVI